MSSAIKDRSSAALLAGPAEVAPEAWLLYLGVVTAALALLMGSIWGSSARESRIRRSVA